LRRLHAGTTRRGRPQRLAGDLDLYDEETRTNFELDGAKHHAGPADRERDLRRDAAQAAVGITVVRFTHDRLVRASAEVRAQAAKILAVRRAA
jgi:very-short-patch-repair endonuclease